MSLPEIRDLKITFGGLDALSGLSLPGDGMISDLHGSGDYRAHLVAVMTKRAVAALT